MPSSRRPRAARRGAPVVPWSDFRRAIRWLALALAASGSLVGLPFAAGQLTGNRGLIAHANTNQTADADAPTRIEDYVSIGCGADGVKRYELRAKVFEKLTPGTRRRAPTFRVEQPVLTVFFNGASLLTIAGDAGQSDPQGMFLLKGHARLTSSDGRYRIAAHSLRFFLRRKRITTPDEVTITGPDVAGKGLGLMLDCVERRIELFGDSRLSVSQGEVPRFLVDALTALPQALEACRANLGNPAP